jgi:hypothetical protein
VGNDGGASSSPSLPVLLGGLLNGVVSCFLRGLRSRAGLGSPNTEVLEAAEGFSARLMGGGKALESCLFSSPDLRGGGGDGGCEAVNRGDLRGSRTGVCGRLGILNGRGDPDGVVGVVTVSGFKNWGTSPWARFITLPLGGDIGGCTRTAGAFNGRGVNIGGFARRVGERGATAVGSSVPDTCIDDIAGRSRGLAGITGEASLLGLRSRNLSGFGAGERVRRGGAMGFGVPSPVLFMFSNFASSDETGF